MTHKEIINKFLSEKEEDNWLDHTIMVEEPELEVTVEKALSFELGGSECFMIHRSDVREYKCFVDDEYITDIITDDADEAIHVLIEEINKRAFTEEEREEGKKLLEEMRERKRRLDL